jgi:DNA topoisomerase-1
MKQKRALKDQKIERVTFNAITKQAVTEAMKHPAPDRRRAGRCLPGAPRAGLSGRLHALAGAVAQAAGRPLGRPRAVGGAAARLRPRARDRAFVAREYWSLVATLATPRGDAFEARLVGADGKKIQRSTSARAEAEDFKKAIEAANFTVTASRPSRRGAIPTRPSPPRRCSRKPAASSALPRAHHAHRAAAL